MRPRKRTTTQVAVLSMGCPRGVGPEICVASALAADAPSTVIVGNRRVLMAAAGKLRQDPAIIEALPAFQNGTPDFSGCMLLEVGPDLRVEDRNWGHPDEAAGVAQLEYVERGYALAREHGWPLITAPVSKEVIARCGLRRARTFRGHTEWLEKLDAAGHSVMCFSSSRLTCSLVTTHVPIRALAKAISPQLVTKACCELVDLLLRRGVSRPRVAVCSLNPHGGEGELLGKEEGSAILPGIRDAASVVGRRAKLLGPAGAETAFRKAAAGDYDGVVAMYHDQATIPMKLLDFGGAVNVTQGLSIVRTSVDHGTAYDIAGEGVVDARGMMAALDLGLELSGTKRRIQHGSW